MVSGKEEGGGSVCVWGGGCVHVLVKFDDHEKLTTTKTCKNKGST
jgi:hypothetical protein